jgi:HAD superfamily hydrolase (TIGR01549 family)
MRHDRPALPPFDAVSLDVGGVLVLPDRRMVSRALKRAGVRHDPARFFDGHYRAMAEIDRRRPRPEEFGVYARGFLRAVGAPDAHLGAGAPALESVLGLSSVWSQRIRGAVPAARRLAATGVRLAVTSNSDGTVAERMRRRRVMQIGDGPGVPVEHITDSGVLGVAKPDPAMFLATAAALALPAERVCHVGDSGCYDADGASAIGMVAVHLDPLGLCDGDHHHADSLADFCGPLTRGAPCDRLSGRFRHLT